MLPSQEPRHTRSSHCVLPAAEQAAWLSTSVRSWEPGLADRLPGPSQDTPCCCAQPAPAVHPGSRGGCRFSCPHRSQAAPGPTLTVRHSWAPAVGGGIAWGQAQRPPLGLRTLLSHERQLGALAGLPDRTGDRHGGWGGGWDRVLGLGARAGHPCTWGQGGTLSVGHEEGLSLAVGCTCSLLCALEVTGAFPC